MNVPLLGLVIRLLWRLRELWVSNNFVSRGSEL